MKSVVKYLLLKPMQLQIGQVVRKDNENSIFIAYKNREEAFNESENGKYQIYEITFS